MGDPYVIDLPEVSILTTSPSRWQGDLLVLAIAEQDVHVADGLSAVKSDTLSVIDEALIEAVHDAMACQDFEGKKGQTSAVVRLPGSCQAQRLLLLGLGKQSAGPGSLVAAGTALAAASKRFKASSVAVACPHAAAWPAPGDSLAALAGAALSGLFSAGRFKSAKAAAAQGLRSLALLLLEEQPVDAGAVKQRALAIGRGSQLAKLLTEAPGNMCTPSYLAGAAAHIAASHPDTCQLEVLEREACEQLGMGLFCGVAQGSELPPKLVHLTYTPLGGEHKRKLALVGKGLTFDSGGYNLKVEGGIEMMKCDMAGAAAVLGAAAMIAELQPRGVQVHVITAACENMISGRATRPSDVHVAASGKTVEVNDTDAEGRLTLADALWFAQEKCGAQAVVDIATLTGACMVALGSDIGGLFASSDDVAKGMQAAARRAGERFWQLPLDEEYVPMIESKCADLKNYAGRYAGAITAALFLKEFVHSSTDWLHLDVAGPVWDDKAGLPTGFGVTTLTEWVLGESNRVLAA